MAWGGMARSGVRRRPACSTQATAHETSVFPHCHCPRYSWLKLEDVRASLFVAAARKRMKAGRRLGDRVPRYSKFLQVGWQLKGLGPCLGILVGSVPCCATRCYTTRFVGCSHLALLFRQTLYMTISCTLYLSSVGLPHPVPAAAGAVAAPPGLLHWGAHLHHPHRRVSRAQRDPGPGRPLPWRFLRCPMMCDGPGSHDKQDVRWGSMCHCMHGEHAKSPTCTPFPVTQASAAAGGTQGGDSPGGGGGGGSGGDGGGAQLLGSFPLLSVSTRYAVRTWGLLDPAG